MIKRLVNKLLSKLFPARKSLSLHQIRLISASSIDKKDQRAYIWDSWK
jgi:hypothetical protein